MYRMHRLNKAATAQTCILHACGHHDIEMWRDNSTKQNSRPHIMLMMLLKWDSQSPLTIYRITLTQADQRSHHNNFILFFASKCPDVSTAFSSGGSRLGPEGPAPSLFVQAPPVFPPTTYYYPHSRSGARQLCPIDSWRWALCSHLADSAYSCDATLRNFSCVTSCTSLVHLIIPFAPIFTSNGTEWPVFVLMCR